ncbi:MAG: hypothetical protein FRX49_03214 [Trebouxia sp. A1-2]|nr:MAG: hypothetical protein FRX49_03214 [Trebouxia sp. A1-2]
MLHYTHTVEHEDCRQGQYDLDPHINFLWLPPVRGALRKYVDHPAGFCCKLPDCLTLDQRALVEPLSIAGLVMLAAAKAFSVSSVAIPNIRPGNLPVAHTLGEKYALDKSKAVSTAENVEAIRAVFPKGPDIAVDCAGFSTSMVHQPVGEGKIQAEALITHRLGISEAEVLKGFQLASNSATIGDIKKIILACATKDNQASFVVRQACQRHAMPTPARRSRHPLWEHQYGFAQQETLRQA